ncbi:ABC transporter ATP-binding protein [Phaeovibrio sulfidiphilus]|uniref:ABC transporter ATP-binding protein n=1 Tax=Phaeovibrio sulfidiphilus TaxID=1220600 RepID=A0A8J7CD81_9PROT|nr:ABC transporter ATP-binding protein [Phaeovibrio sulfidiphilus]MBE1237548.1 ABC transporter ATP-binding protein [Phaeovibrio sulfidiphilus]
MNPALPASDTARDAATLTAPDTALSIEGLSKRYAGGKLALDSVSLNVPRGAFFGLLGPNGAGKSTLINIMAGLVRKTSGRVRIWDRDLDRDERNARLAIGVVPQELNFDPFFTPREILSVQAGLYGVPRKERRTMELLEAVGLADQADSYARALSGGMKRRLLVAKAMVHRPPILILDEPTAGVDVELRQHLWSMIRALNDEGTTILLTTHYLEEAQELCDTIAIINHGQVVVCEPTRDLLARVDARCLVVTLRDPVDTVPERLAALGMERRDSRTLVLCYHARALTMDSILGALHDSGLSIEDMAIREADLEDVFLQLTRSGAAGPARA